MPNSSSPERIEPHFGAPLKRGRAQKNEEEPLRNETRGKGAPKQATKASSAQKNRSVKKQGQRSRQNSRLKKGHSFWLWRLFRFFLRPLPFLFYWGAVAGLWLLIGVAGVFGYYGAQLPSAKDWAIPKRPPNIRILANDGSLISNRGVTGGKALRLEEMSPSIIQAVIAIEDRRFHSHFGFDPIGFTRAMTRNLKQGRMREGASTITQQLAKNLFLKPDRTFGRKVQELILSVWLETKYSKADILELYLNRVYFGAGATGVDSAARRYFGKSASKVSIAEAALLAGLLKAPSRYSPAKNPKLAQTRARVVLKAMQREGYLKNGNLDVYNLKPGQHARHFRSGPEHFVADMVVKEVKQRLGTIKRDIIVKTTLSPYLMTAADALLKTSLDKYGQKKRVSQAALISISPDGAIRALIGGRNYGKSQFNRAVEAKRQPGSAFKTFVWLSALERGATPQTIIEDKPVRYGRWQPKNYDKKYRGSVTLAHAFEHSLNTVAAQLTMKSGPKNVVATARRMGIGSHLKANASLSLGTSEVSLMEMTAAYAPFANGGMKAKPYLIEKISSDKGKLLFKHQAPLPLEVLDPRVLGMMNVMLRGVVKQGTGKAAYLKNHPAGGKTGTSQNFRDALFIGYTSHFVTGVWFGNDNNKPTKKLTGGSLPAQVWHDFMQTAHHDVQIKQLPGQFGQGVYLSVAPERLPLPVWRPQHPAQSPQRTLVQTPRSQPRSVPRPPKIIGDLSNEPRVDQTTTGGIKALIENQTN